MNQKYPREAGTTFMEVLVAVSIIAVIIVAVGFSITSYVNARAALLTNARALYLTEEGYEILRALRDDDWNTIDALTIGDTYSFDVTASTLAISTTPEVIDGEFTRTFVVDEVERDTDDDIDLVSGTGTVDPEIRLVTVSVSGPTGVTSMQAILTNINAI